MATETSKSGVLSRQELAAWQGMLRANAYLLRELDKDLRRYQLNLSSHDVLLQLALAPRRRLRMSSLAEAVLLSPSGLSRLVDQLEREGLVVREQRADDARSYDVVLSPQGRKRLKAANHAHLLRIRELFVDHLSPDQISQLVAIWNAIDPRFITGRPSTGVDATPEAGT